MSDTKKDTTNSLDLYHRGFKAYGKEVKEKKACEAFEKAVIASDRDKERMETSRYRCVVLTDWIEHIEAAMPFIAKAVGEKRQFILQLGNTVLIEKAKRISKASVENLSKHCEYITRPPKENEVIIPEKIYVTENTGNFAIYENRFLYTLLCLIRDFADVRYKKISEMWNRFSSEVSVEKNLRVGKRRLEYRLYLKEDARDDEETSYDEETKDALRRIKNIQQEVAALLNTPLMTEVSATPKLKPPITKTNVLRMNMYFRSAMGLYEYLNAYQEDGYIVNEYKTSMLSFPENVSKDFSDITALTSYLTYRHGGGLDETMERAYEEEELRIAKRREEEKAEKLRLLKEKAKESGETADKYLLALEERVFELENIRLAQKETAEALEEYKLAAERSRTEKEALVNELRQKDIVFRTELNREKNASLMLQEELDAQRVSHENELAATEKEKERLTEQQRLLRARLRAVYLQLGRKDVDGENGDFSQKENFQELEKEYKAFKKFYGKSWKTAKKKIRRDALSKVFGNAGEEGGGDE